MASGQGQYCCLPQEGFESNQDLIRLGAILELVHLATLVHDDILDEATVRHGTPTVAAKYGKDILLVCYSPMLYA